MKVLVHFGFVSLQNSLDSSVDLRVRRTGVTGQDPEKDNEMKLNEFESHLLKLVGLRLIFFYMSIEIFF